MIRHTIITDVNITKSKKAHVICTARSAKQTWHATIVGALRELADAGEKEIIIADEETSFHVIFKPTIHENRDPL